MLNVLLKWLNMKSQNAYFWHLQTIQMAGISVIHNWSYSIWLLSTLPYFAELHWFCLFSVINDEDLLKILDLPILVVLDEAYIEFSSLQSRMAWVKKHDNLIVLRTFSKRAGLWFLFFFSSKYAGELHIIALRRGKAKIAEYAHHYAPKTQYAHHYAPKTQTTAPAIGGF